MSTLYSKPEFRKSTRLNCAFSNPRRDEALDFRWSIIEIKFQLEGVFRARANLHVNVCATTNDHIGLAQLMSWIGGGQSNHLHAGCLRRGNTCSRVLQY